MIEEEEARVRESGGSECDMLLKNNIEGIIIKWAYQVCIFFFANFDYRKMSNFKKKSL